MQGCAVPLLPSASVLLHILSWALGCISEETTRALPLAAHGGTGDLATKGYPVINNGFSKGDVEERVFHNVTAAGLESESWARTEIASRKSP